MSGFAGEGVKHVVVIEEAANVSEASLSQLIKGLELSEAKAQRLLERIPGVVTKAIDRSEAELIAERFRWAGFDATARPASKADLAEPEVLEPAKSKAPSYEAAPSEPTLPESGTAPQPTDVAQAAEREPEALADRDSGSQSQLQIPEARTAPPTAEPQLPESQVLKPQIPKPQVTEPQVTEPQVPEPQVPEPQVPEPQTPLTAAAPSAQQKGAEPKLSATPNPVDEANFRIGADVFDTPDADSDETAKAFQTTSSSLLDKRVAEQRKRAADAEVAPKTTTPKIATSKTATPEAAPKAASDFAASFDTKPSDKTGFEAQLGSFTKAPANSARLQAPESAGEPSTPKPPRPAQARVGFQDSHPDQTEAEPSPTIVAEDFGLLRPQAHSPLWLRRLVLALPAFLSVLFVVVYVRGSLVSSITEALRWAPAAVTDVLAVSLEAGSSTTLPNALSENVRVHMNRLQPVLAAQGVEMVLITDARGTFITGWLGENQLSRTPSALVNSLPMVINNARSAGEGRAASLSIPAQRLSTSEQPLILDSRLLDLGGTPAVLSVATPDDSATFISQVSRRSLLAGLIPVLLTVIAAMAFIRKQD